MRLGEVLIQKGLINESQLNRALDAQLVCGGHLGTNLVELGFIDVVTLGQTLAAAFKVKHVHREMIQHITPDVIRLIPHKLVERHQVVPFALRERTLHVAMINPNNLLALDELSFATGYRIETWIAPEVLVVSAMERHYDIPRQIRHIAVSGQSPIRSVQPSPSDASAASPEQSVPAASTEPRDKFVIPPQPRYGVDAQRTSKAPWTKIQKQGAERPTWADIFDVDPNHPQLHDLEGIFVVWHKGERPVLRVGQGPIAEILDDLRLQVDIIEAAKQSEVHVTWAEIAAHERNGIERYLVEMLNPQTHAPLSAAAPIEIDLPR